MKKSLVRRSVMRLGNRSGVPDHSAVPFGRAIKCFLICSAEPRGLCGDPRIFDNLTKVPQVFRTPGGSPLLKIVRRLCCRWAGQLNFVAELLQTFDVVLA